MQNPKQKFVLDYVAERPFAAYGPRRLRADYLGPLLNVRRASDNSTRDLYSDLAGNLNVADLLSFCGAGNGFITAYYDQMGTGNSAIVASSQPTIVSSGALVLFSAASLRPAVQFSGTSTLPLTYTNTTTTQTLSIICAWRGAAAVGTGSVFGTASSGGPQMQVSTTGFGLSLNRANLAVLTGASTGVGSLTTGSITTGVTSATTATIYVNGAVGGTATVAPGFSAPITQIGGSTFVPGEKLTGFVSDQIIYLNTISDSTRLIIERDMARYYGITMAV